MLEVNSFNPLVINSYIEERIRYLLTPEIELTVDDSGIIVTEDLDISNNNEELRGGIESVCQETKKPAPLLLRSTQKLALQVIS